MRFFTTARPLAIALTLLLTAAAIGRPARADQVVQTPQAPVVVIHSTSGLVTVTRGNAGSVRVAGNATATTFQMTSDNQGVMLPRGMGLPPRRLTLPGV